MGQVFLLGLVFLLVFTAYITIQAFASKLYGSTLASNMALTLYAVFTAACFLAPAITNVLGPRFTLFLGSLGAFLAVTVIYAPAFVGAGQLSFEVDSAASSFMCIGLLQAALAGSLALLCLSLMLSFASSLIWGCLVGSVVFAFVASLASFLSGFVLGGVMWLVFGLISVCYA